MKKMLLKTQGYFVDGVFIVDKVKVTKNVIESPYNKGKDLKLGYNTYTQDGIKCGGVEKPAIPDGETGDWFCVNNQWVWFPG